MKYFENLQYPPIPTSPTHFVLESFFIQSEDAPNYETPNNEQQKLINSEVIVLEQFIGYKGLWSKISYNNTVGYVLNNSLTALTQTTPPSIKANTEENFLPKLNAVEIDWTQEQSNIPYDDEKRGRYCIAYDTGLEKIENSFQSMMENSLYEGLLIIFSELGKNITTIEEIKKLQKKYFLFGTAEAIDFSFRQCSTFRVLVSIPKSYAESSIFKRSTEDLFSGDIEPPENNPPQTGGSPPVLSPVDNPVNIIPGNQPNTQPANNPQKRNFIEIQLTRIGFLNEYDNFFNDLVSKVAGVPTGILDVAEVIYNNNNWNVNPPQDLSITKEISFIKNFKQKLDFFILRNLPKNRKIIEEVVKDVYSTNVVSLSAWTQYLATGYTGYEVSKYWEGKLTIKIDVDNLKLTSIRFETPITKKRIKFNIGVKEFLRNEFIQSKTSLNYFVQKYLKLQKFLLLKDIKKRITDKTSPQQLNDIKNSVIQSNPTYKKAIDNYTKFKKEIDEITLDNLIDPKDEFMTSINGLSSSLIGVASSAFQVGASLGAIFTGDTPQPAYGPETELNTFLTKFHYPVIESIEKIPMDAFTCINSFSDNLQRLNSKFNLKIKGNFNRLQQAKINDIIKKEGSEWDKFRTLGINYIQNKDWRYVFNPSEIPEPADPQFSVAWWKFNNYWFPSFTKIGFGEILKDAFTCAVRSIPPEVLAEILKRYSNVKAALDQFISSTLCNPFVSGILNKLTSLDIPELFVYDPNSSLFKILVDFIIESLIKLLSASVKVLLNLCFNNCLNDPNRLLNPAENATGSPFLNNVNDANVDDLLTDLGLVSPNDSLPQNFYGGPQLEPWTEIEKEIQKSKEKDEAKKIITSALSDATCFMSVSEICSLLKNKTVTADVYDLFLKVIEANYPDLRNKISTHDDVKIFFTKIGGLIQVDFCEIMEQNQIPDTISCSCQDDEINAARETILNGFDPRFPPPLDDSGRPIGPTSKRLKPEEVKAIINATKEKDKKGVEDIIKFLDNPAGLVDPSKTPPFLCKKLPNGTVVPPALNINPPIENFKRMIDSNVKNSYKLFDDEASIWPATTYSIAPKPEAKKVVYIDSSGNLTKNDNVLKEITNTTLTEEESQKKTATMNISCSLLYSNLLDKFTKNNTNFVQDQQNNIYLFNDIDGNEIQKFDIDIIEEKYLREFKKQKRNLAQFCKSVLRKLVEEPITAQKVIDILKKSSQSLTTLPATNVAVTVSSNIPLSVKSIKLLDLMLRCTYTTNEPWYSDLQLMTGFKYSDGQTSEGLFIDSTGGNAYKKVMEQLIVDKENIYKFIGRDTNLGITFTNLIKMYNEGDNGIPPLKNYSDTASGILFQYPKYTLDYRENLKSSKLNYPADKITAFSKNDFDIFTTSSLKIYKNLDIPSDNTPGGGYVNISQEAYFNIETINYITDEQIKNKIGDQSDKTLIFKDIPYEDIYNKIFMAISTNIKTRSVFMKKIKIPEPITIGKDEKKTTIDIYKPFTEFLKLVIPLTKQQEFCGITPHFLDIDMLKKEAIEGKKTSYCLEEAANAKTRENQPLNSSELENIETNDVQKVLANFYHRLTLRAYITDILLRGINVFGFYEPQQFRDEPLFINFISNIVESEMKGEDLNYYNLLTSFFIQKFNRNNPDKQQLDSSKQSDRKYIFKEMIKQELKSSCLPKLSKRIMEDTVDEINKFRPNNGNGDLYFDDGKLVPRTIELKNLNDLTSISIDEAMGMIGPNTWILNNQFTYSDGRREKTIDISKEQDKKTLFEYVFPLKTMVTILFIENVLATSCRRQVVNTFISTKASLRKLGKLAHSSGQPVLPDLNNPQEVNNSDPYLELLGQIIKIIITTPPKIVKSFIEGADPNAALSSGIYKVVKQLTPVPSLIIPAIGLPLGAWPGSPFMFNPLNVIYYATGLWIDFDDATTKNESQKNKIVDDLLNAEEDFDCSTATEYNMDRVILAEKIGTTYKESPDGYYIKKVNADLIKQKTDAEIKAKNEKVQEEVDLEEQLD